MRADHREIAADHDDDRRLDAGQLRRQHHVHRRLEPRLAVGTVEPMHPPEIGDIRRHRDRRRAGRYLPSSALPGSASSLHVGSKPPTSFRRLIAALRRARSEISGAINKLIALAFSLPVSGREKFPIDERRILGLCYY